MKRTFFLSVLLYALLIACCSALFFASCRKVVPLSVKSNILPLVKLSKVRLLNFSSPLEVTVGSLKITSDIADINAERLTTPFFLTGLFEPGQGILGTVASGNPYFLPDTLVGKADLIRAKIRYKYFNPDKAPDVFGTDGVAEQLTAFPGGATDVYITEVPAGRPSKGFQEGYNTDPGPRTFIPTISYFPRDETPPANPDAFKIRIINLGNSSPGSNLVGTGNVSLTYSDGTPVSAASSSISIGRASDYVDIPFGTYNFRVVSSDGLIIPEKFQTSPNDFDPTNPNNANALKDVFSYPYALNAAQLNVSDRGAGPFSFFKTYLSGGIYTIVIAPFNFDMNAALVSRQPPVYTYYYNGFELVEDKKPNPPLKGRAQVVNAYPQNDLMDVSIDGIPLSSLPYTTYTEFKPLVPGLHRLSARLGGRALLDSNFAVETGDNLSLWVWKNSTGKAAMVRSNNDFAGSKLDVNRRAGHTINGCTATADFLNLSPDAGKITFQRYTVNVSGNGTPVPIFNNIYLPSATALAPGEIPLNRTSLVLPLYVFGEKFRFFNNNNLFGSLGAYQVEDTASQANRLPKAPIPVIPYLINPLTFNQEFLAKNGSAVFKEDIGVFSFALIGLVNTSNPFLKARFLAIRHLR